MHRNTLILVFSLALLAAVVAAVNVYRFFHPFRSDTTPVVASATPTPILSPIPMLAEYKNAMCGITLSHPTSLTVLDDASGSAVLTDEKTKTAIIVTCQKDIPRPPLPEDKIETVKVASITAKLYHDASAKDGTPIDKLIFRHPKKHIDVFIAGLGDTFKQIIATVTIL